MKYFPHLKIEFRAVEYSSSHVLQYRISSDQDLYYEEEKNILGLFKIKLKKKFKTDWHQPYVLVNYPGAYRYSKESGEPYLPIFLHNKEEFEEYKTKFKTIGEFLEYKHKIDAEEESKWIVDRMNYLNNCGTWK